MSKKHTQKPEVQNPLDKVLQDLNNLKAIDSTKGTSIDYFKKIAKDNNIDINTYDITSSRKTPSSINDIHIKQEELGRNFTYRSNNADYLPLQDLKQTDLDAFINSLGGAAEQMVAGFVDSVASWDAKGIYDMAYGNTEEEYGNWLNKIGESIREDASERFKIYNSGNSFFSMEHWANIIQSYGYTLGIIAETIGEQMLMASLSGGTTNIAGLAKKSNLLKQAGFGMFKGIQEGYMNALETAGNVEREFIQLGYSEEEAKKKAAEAATMNFREEVGPLMVLNSLQFMATFGTITTPWKVGQGVESGFSGAVETAMEKILPKNMSGWKKSLTGYGVVSISEGVEEGIQSGVQKHVTQRMYDKYNIDKKVDYFDEEMLDSVVSGALFGAAFKGFGSLASRYITDREGYKRKKLYEEKLNTFVSEAYTNTAEAVNKYKAAETEYKKAVSFYNKDKNLDSQKRLALAEKALKEAQHNTHLVQTINALKLDYLNGKETAFQTHVEGLEKMLQAAESNDIEELKKAGLVNKENKEVSPGAIQHIKETFGKQIENSKWIKSKFEDNLLNVTSDFNSAFDILQEEFKNKINREDLNEHSEALNLLYAESKEFKSLSPEAQEKFKLESEKQGLELIPELSKESKKRLEEINKELKEAKPYTREEAMTIKAMQVSPFVAANTSIHSISQEINDNNEKISKLKDPKVIKNKVKTRIKEAIEEANTEEKTEVIKEEIDNLDDKTKEELEAELKAKEDKIAAQKAANQTIPGVTNRRNVVKPKSEKPAKAAKELHRRLGSFTQAIGFEGGTVNTNPTTSQSTQKENSEDQAFSKYEFQKEKIDSEKAKKIKELVNNNAKRLDRRLNTKAEFEDFIADLIKKFGYEAVEQRFDGYVYAWSLLGRSVSNSNEVFSKYFESYEMLNEALDELLTPTEEANKKNNEKIDQTIQDNSGYSAFTEDNKPAVPVLPKEELGIEDTRTTSPVLKIAHTHLSYDGMAGDKITNTDKLSEGDEKHFILDYDFIKEGTELTMVPLQGNELLNAPVQYWFYNDDTSKWDKKEVTFREWLRLTKTKINSPEYYNKVPIKLYVGNIQVNYLHDTEWYNDNNISDFADKREVISKAVKELSRVRQNLFKNGQKTLKVSKRRFGNVLKIDKISNPKNLMPLSQAVGEEASYLAVATAQDEFEIIDENGNKKTLKINLINKKDLVPGLLYDIRKVNTDEYMAFPTRGNDISNNETIDDTAFYSSMYSTLATIYLIADQNPRLREQLELQYGMNLSKANNIYQNILNATGIDIKTNLDKYLKLFVFSSEKEVLQNIMSNKKYPNGIYLALEKNSIGFGVKKDKISYNKDGSIKTKYINFSHESINNKKEINIRSILANINYLFGKNDSKRLKTNQEFRKVSKSVSKEFLNKSKKFKSFITLDENGNIINNPKNTYQSYIRDTFKTNIKSFKIKTHDGKTKWVTDIQPMVELTDDFKKDIKPKEEIKPEEKVDTTKAPKKTHKQKSADYIAKKTAEYNELFGEGSELATQLIAELHKKESLNDFIEDSDEHNSPFEFEDPAEEEAMISSLLGIHLNKIDGLTLYEQYALSRSLFNKILSDVKVTDHKINLKDLTNKIENSLETYLNPRISELTKMINGLKSAQEKLGADKFTEEINKFTAEIAKLEKVIEQKDKLVSSDTNKPGELFKSFEVFLSEELSEIAELEEVNNTGEVENNFSMSSFEKDVKLSFSNNLKVFFSGIKVQKNGSFETIRNWSGLEEYHNAEDVIEELRAVMIGLPSSIEMLLDNLKTKKADNHILNQIYNKLINTDKIIQNEILYKLIQDKLVMNMVLYSKTSKGTSLKIMNANSNSNEVVLKTQWARNFENSDIFYTNDKYEKLYNKKVLKNISNEIKRIYNDTTSKNIKDEKENIHKIFKQLGFNISLDTVEDLLNRKGKRLLSTNGFLGQVNATFHNIINNKKEIKLDDESNSIYKSKKMYAIINEMVELELKNTSTVLAKSFRVESKTYQSATQKNMLNFKIDNLKDTNSELYKNLSMIPYSSGNYLLELLKNNEVNKFFDISYLSPVAIKENSTKIFGKTKINQIPLSDSTLTQLAFFLNTSKKLSGVKYKESNLEFRMAQMFSPTLSDKEQMGVINTVALDLQRKDIKIYGDNVVFSDEINNFLFEQLFLGEFKRILSAHRNSLNIKGYDSAAKRFIAFPELNEIKSKKGLNIHTLIESLGSKELSDQEILELAEEFKYEATKVIVDSINIGINEKVNLKNSTGEWFKYDFIKYTNKNDKNKKKLNLKTVDHTYISAKGKSLSGEEMAKLMAADFVLNQYLSQNNIYQLIAGDLALYAPKPSRFMDESGKIDNLAFTKAVGESVTKRAAMLIAPGNLLADSHGDTYTQIFLNDPISISTVAESLIKQYYGEIDEEGKKLLDSIDLFQKEIYNYYKSDLEDKQLIIEDLEEELDSIRAELKKKYKDIGDYFDIEATDAQEYTTWKEHIEILFRQGRLNEKDTKLLKSAYNKLLKEEEVSKEELRVVMNPIKPVYAGSTFEHDNNGNPILNRIVYIKSSSLPLLPQLTANLEIDSIRKHIEHLQEKTGKNVRISYQTANKVGAINSSLSVNDLYHLSTEEIQDKLEANSLTLNRENFKIQQDTPYKTAKFLAKHQDDYATMGSQIWKVLMGSGVNKIQEKVFKYNGGKELISYLNSFLPDDKQIIPTKDGKVSGEELDRIKFLVEKEYFKRQKELLYDELGIADNGDIIDKNKTVEALHKLLKREAITRGYPENIKEALDLVSEEGELKHTLPLWLSNNSEKFESLIQAIITNRFINIKLPGNMLISSSSEGFVKKTLDQVSEGIKSQIVWLNKNSASQPMRATRYENGKIKEAEVLIQSKFRITTKDENGKLVTKLIDLTSEEYSTRDENGNLILNAGMIDDELLSHFSFRIPTSSLQSGAILKVVGFLPEESGDMLVVPGDHTIQIGEDYDVDKRTLYNSNYKVNKKTGKISKVNFKDLNALKEEKNKQLIYEYIEEYGIERLEDNPDIIDKKNPFNNKKYINKQEIKFLENAIVDVYKSVYTTSDSRVQNNINKVLSFKVAKDTANAIESAYSLDKDYSGFTLYSDTYQREQMVLGATGKEGIGKHSNAVTLQAQLERLSENVIIQKYEDNNYVPVKITLGKYTSEGKLGLINTLDGKRTIMDVHAENQNSATDNVKAQIMGKRNENKYTMGVLIQLTLRGFDLDSITTLDGKTIDANISSLFISQPIIKEYVDLMESKKSILSEFDKDSKENIINTLIQKYSNNTYANLEAYKNNFNEEILKELTGQALYNNLVNVNNEQQLAVLKTFLELEEENKELVKYHQLINQNTSGLGLSYLDVLNKLETFKDLATNKNFKGIQNLIGEIITSDELDIDEDFVELTEGIYIKPTTTEGTTFVNSMSIAQTIMDLHFPYKMSVINEFLNEVLKTKEDISSFKKRDLQYQALLFLKDYLFSDSNLGLSTKDTQSLRYELFLEDKTNSKESLASYMYKLKTDKHPIITKNILLNDFSYELYKRVTKNKTDQLGRVVPGRKSNISLIVHESQSKTNFSQENKHKAYLELLHDTTTVLPDFNGKPMTGMKLAQYLAAYAYLANNEKGAIGFRNYVSVKYLDAIGVAKKMREINSKPYLMNVMMTNALKQFYQHKPKEAFILSPQTIKVKDFNMLNTEANKIRYKLERKNSIDEFSLNSLLKNVTSFTLTEDADKGYKFISIRNNKSHLGFNLFERNDKGIYRMIPVLGTFGFNEMDPSQDNITSLIEQKFEDNIELTNEDVLAVKKEDKITKETTELNFENTFNAHSGMQPSELLNLFLEDPLVKEETKEYIRQILPFVNDNINIEIGEFSTSRGKLKSSYFNSATNTIHINNKILTDVKAIRESGQLQHELLASIMLEEVIHSITVENLRKHGTLYQDGTYTPNADAPSYILRLARAYDLAREAFPYNSKTNENYYTKNIIEFTAGVFADKEFREKLDSTKHNGKSLLELFKKALQAMHKALLGNKFSKEVQNTVLDLLNGEINMKESKSILQEDKNLQEVSSMSEYINHSGGANGADTLWDIMGRKFGVITHNHYREPGQNTVDSYELNNLGTKAIQMSEEDYNEGQKIATIAARQLGKISPEHQVRNKYMIRNYAQIKNSDGVFAIGELIEPGTEMKYGKIAKIKQVKGGTGLTVQMGINKGLPIYVFDHVKEQWYKYDYNKKDFIETDVPTLTKNFTGIGTREVQKGINREKALKAIEDVYKKTSENINKQENLIDNSQNKTELNKEKTINIYSTDKNGFEDLSNFTERPFVYKGEEYNSVEGAFQAQKIHYTSEATKEEKEKNKKIFEKLKTLTGLEAQKEGRKIHPLDKEDWDFDSQQIMRELVLESFKQNPKAKEKLLSTGDAKLTHIGAKGKWKETFPRILMEVRNELAGKKDKYILYDNQDNTYDVITNDEYHATILENVSKKEAEEYLEKFNNLQKNTQEEVLNSLVDYYNLRNTDKNTLENELKDLYNKYRKNNQERENYRKELNGLKGDYRGFQAVGAVIKKKISTTAAKIALLNIVEDLNKYKKYFKDSYINVIENGYYVGVKTSNDLNDDLYFNKDIQEGITNLIARIVFEDSVKGVFTYKGKKYDAGNVHKNNELVEYMLNYLDNQKNELQQKEELKEEKNKTKKEPQKSVFTYKGTSIDIDFTLGEEQEKALKEAIDHVLDYENKLPFKTIQGSAGTGKTTIVSLLEKYIKKNNSAYKFRYISPTHAANVNLALANLKNGINEYPRTIQSTMVYNPAKKQMVLKKEAVPTFGIPVFIVDEASMLEQKDVNNFVKLVKEIGGKVIFLGDIAQIPSPGSTTNKVTSVFDKKYTSILNKVYRQKQNDLLKIATKIRNNDKIITYKVENSDGSIMFLPHSEYNKMAIKDFKENPDGTIFIAYTNKRVKELNRGIKEVMTGTDKILVGDKLVGGLGKQSKSPQKNSIANAINYTVEKIENKNGVLHITSRSKVLDKIKTKIRSISSVVNTRYYALSSSDSIQHEEFTEETYRNNNLNLSNKIGDNFRSLYTALISKDRNAWKTATEHRILIAEFFTDRDLGGNYVFNIKTGLFEPYNFEKHTKMYGRHLKEMTVEKGVDYGYAITAHKAQGMTIDNVYIDLQNIQSAGKDSVILDTEGNKINSLKNTLYYVAMTRASNKTVINTTGLGFDIVIKDGQEVQNNSTDNTDPKLDAMLNSDTESMVPMENNLKSFKTYNNRTKSYILNKFNKGEKLLITPSNKRAVNIQIFRNAKMETIPNPERLLVNDIIQSLEKEFNVKITKGNISNYIEFKPLDSNSVIINKKVQEIKKENKQNDKPKLKSLKGKFQQYFGDEQFSIYELPVLNTRCK